MTQKRSSISYDKKSFKKSKDFASHIKIIEFIMKNPVHSNKMCQNNYSSFMRYDKSQLELVENKNVNSVSWT